MTVTIFSTSTCQRCSTVKLHLDRRGIAYTEVILNNDRAQAVELRKQGFNEAPVVKVEQDGVVQWSEGYRPDFLDSLAPAS